MGIIVTVILWFVVFCVLFGAFAKLSIPYKQKNDRGLLMFYLIVWPIFVPIIVVTFICGLLAWLHRMLERKLNNH